MAATAGFKDLLIRKGEKFALFGAVGLLGLFVIWGVVTAAGADNPEKRAKEIENGTRSVRTKIDGDKELPTKLPMWAEPTEDKNDFQIVAISDYAHRGYPFETTDSPSLRRDQPRVLTPVESQINYYAASYKAYDRKFSEKDGEINIDVGVLISAKENPADAAALRKFLMDLKGKPITKKGVVRPMPTRPSAGTPMGPPGAPPTPGGPPPGPAGMRPPIGSGGGMAGGTVGTRSETKVAYKSIEEATKLGLPLAVAVYPIRMAVIQMSFPLEAQLLEIKQALRLRTLAEARYESSPATIGARSGAPVAGGAAPPGGPPMPGGVGAPPMPGAPGVQGTSELDSAPAFVGLVVERMTIPPEGIPADISKEKYEAMWDPLDHQERFFNRFTRYDAPFVKEEGYKPYFLRPEQGISAPLPVLADGFAHNYPPDTTLGTIYTNYKRLEDSNAQKKTADDAKARFKYGATNPYAAPPTTGSYSGSFGDDAPRPGMPGMGGMFRPPLPGSLPMTGGGTDPEGSGGTGSQAVEKKLDVDHLLLRFLDVDLEPGNSYQYRVKVLMKSPNYRNKGGVSDESIANQEVLESAWYDVPQKLSIPQESFLYAYSAKKYEDAITKIYDASGKADTIRNVAEIKELKEGKRTVVQMQQWIERLLLQGDKQEPIGSWIQAEMPVAVGEFVGKRVPVELPLWRSAALNYVLPLGDTKTSIYPNWPKDTNNNKYTMPKMRVLDFRTKNVLVAFEGGGHTNTVVGKGTVVDDSAAEILMVREDGKIEVHSETRDMVEHVAPTPPTARAQRDKAWKDWLERIRKVDDTETTGTGMGTAGPGRPTGDGGR